MVRYTTVTDQGGRPYQEDTFANVQILPNCCFCGIFDGHGGDVVSKMSAVNFPLIIKQGIQDTPYDLSEVVNKSFYAVDNLAYIMNVPYVGSTVVFTLITPDTVWFANAGDSICIVGYKDGSCSQMSQEHKVEFEKDRIIQSGGIITNFDGVARVNGNLNVSRSVGDHNLKKWVTCAPYVRSVTSGKSDILYIILASDGISDVLRVDALNKLINDHLEDDRQYLLENIVSLSKQLGSTDNITITLIDF